MGLAASLITDLAIWRPHPETKELTVTSLHRGVTREFVQENCGSPVRFDDVVEETSESTALELGTLRDLQARTAAAHQGKKS